VASALKTESVVRHPSCGNLSLVIRFTREHAINYDNGIRGLGSYIGGWLSIYLMYVGCEDVAE
jgi:hypothetical protein